GRTLLVCHVSPSLVSLWVPGGSRVDGGDLDLGQRLTGALTLAVAVLVLVLHDDDLGALGGLDDLGLHRHLGQLVGVGRDRGPVHEEQRRELDGIAGLTGHLVDEQDIAHRHLLLATASANNRVHSGTHSLIRVGSPLSAPARPHGPGGGTEGLDYRLDRPWTKPAERRNALFTRWDSG